MDAWGCGRQHCWKKYMRYSYRLLHRYYECWSSGDVAHLKPFWLQQIAASFIGLKVLFRDVRDIPRYICSGIIMGCGATTGVISTGESAGQVPDQMDARFQLIGWVHICFVSSPALLYLLFGIMITHDSLKITVKRKHTFMVQDCSGGSKPSTKSASQSHTRNPTWLAGRY